jgi:hypothetical protein
MRRLVQFLLVVLTVVAPIHGEQKVTPVTLDQASQLLAAAHHESDSKLARRLSHLQLTERADQATLEKWLTESPGKHTRRAVTELADASAFLPAPESDILAQAMPEPAEMSQIIVRAIAYVKQSMPRLPDFYAQRTTTHFEDAPALQQDLRNTCNSAVFRSLCLANSGANIPPSEVGSTPLHFESSAVATVTYRDGKEVTNKHWESAIAPSQLQNGLVTSGEFGPILMVVLSDALHGKIFWDSWQRSASGELAVFRYIVSKDKSHFLVSCPSVNGYQDIFPSYHGKFAIDPATGTVFRITMISDLEPPYEDQVASIVVEYHSVLIGGTPYICPVRGVAFSRVPVFSVQGGRIVKLPLMQTRLNDITFTRFHLFRAEMKILPDSAGSSSVSPMPPANAAH